MQLQNNQNSLCHELSCLQEKICLFKKEISELSVQKQDLHDEIQHILFTNSVGETFSNSNNICSNDPIYSTGRDSHYDQDNEILDSSKRSYINFKKSLIDMDNQSTEVKQYANRPLQNGCFTNVKDRNSSERLSNNGHNSIPLKSSKSKSNINNEKSNSITYQKKKPSNLQNNMTWIFQKQTK